MSLLQSPKKRALPRAERDRQIVQLRALGRPIAEIAERVGCCTRTCDRVVQHRLAELTHAIRFDSQLIRAQHLLETEMLRGRLGPVLASNDHGIRVNGVRAWLQLLERESKLLGLDHPLRVEVAAQAQAAEELLQHLADRLPRDAMEAVVAALTDAPIHSA